ncbi:hypothetical protein [Sphingomonas sp. TREG-RG-20F-R18-01]|uniref:DUF7946 domain-containing protein n=1 Tax=Sphingomonas sp. TREG-RG-20F-R18-01 TaxID=2914982 RepID=UPI001F59FA63|nr:hypothetical protein [Sphingomonas sp. TREG-RG-20F-R18-01]
MPVIVPFRLTLTGDTADDHQFQGYDGYMALAGFAWTLSLIANYADTGKIRQRGDFDGRHAVRANALEEGSVIADFFVNLRNDPADIFGVAAAAIPSGRFLDALVRRVINRNLGQNTSDDAIAQLLENRSTTGDVEALVAIAEAPIRQAHGVIGAGADEILISGGININPISKFTHETKEYVKQNIEDNTLTSKLLTVSAFNANSGYGSVFDHDEGHVIPFSMRRETLGQVRQVFSWGLDQYANRTGGRINATFTRILAMDKRPKRYVIVRAEPVVNK